MQNPAHKQTWVITYPFRCLWASIVMKSQQVFFHWQLLKVSAHREHSVQCEIVMKLLSILPCNFTARLCEKPDRWYVCCPFRKTRDDLNCYQEQCDAILKDVSAALEHLDSLQKQYLFVSNKTGTLHEACEQLLKEQVRTLLLFWSLQPPSFIDIAKTWSGKSLIWNVMYFTVQERQNILYFQT